MKEEQKALEQSAEASQNKTKVGLKENLETASRRRSGGQNKTKVGLKAKEGALSYSTYIVKSE